MVIRPEMFGAVPDGKHDCTSAIREAVAASVACGGIHFSSGLYRITDTIKLSMPKQTGLRIECDAGCDGTFYMQPDTPTSIKRCGSAIVWDGPTNEPMLRYDSSYLTWDGPALLGRYSDGDGNVASTGLRIEKGSGIGTGKIDFRQLTVCGVSGPAIHAAGDNNCDMINMRYGFFRDCGSVFRVESAQNTANRFGWLSIYNVDVAFDFAILAHTQVDYMAIHRGCNTLVRSANGSGGGGGFSLGGAKIDAPNKNMCLVDAGWTTGHWGTRSEFTLANITGAGGEHVKLRGESTVTLRDCGSAIGKDFLTAESISQFRVNLLIDNCCVYEIPRSHGFTSVRVRNCRDRHSIPIPDITT